MANYNRNGWLDTVMEQVRCKPERKVIRAELQGHLEDKEQYFLDSGMDPREAAMAAVEAMGDPVKVGKELDQAHPFFWGKLYAVCKVVIVLLGIVVFFFGLDGVIGDDWKAWLKHYPLQIVTTDPTDIDGAVILEDRYEPIKQSGYTMDVTQAYWLSEMKSYGAQGVQTNEDVLRVDIKVANPRPWAASPSFIKRLQVLGNGEAVLNKIYSREANGSLVGIGLDTQYGWYDWMPEVRYWDAWYFKVELTGVSPGEEVTLYLPGNDEVKWTFHVEVSQ